MSPSSGRSARRDAFRVVALVVVTALAAACSSSSDGGAGPDAPLDAAPTTAAASTSLVDAACTEALRVETTGTVSSDQITEASGLAASRRNPGIWWVENDSGDTARFFGIDVTGRLRVTESVTGATAQDWEDLAVGPPRDASGGETLYLADIGDNNRVRDDIRVYRLPEPAVAMDTLGATGSATADELTLTYPDGAHDAEALLVDPDGGDLVIVTKDWSLAGHSEIYRAPSGLAAGSSTVLERVGAVDLPAGALVTGADVSPDGSVVALRTYGGVLLYRRAPGEPVWSAFSTIPCAGPLPSEKQGEAVGFSADGTAYATISEGSNPELHLTHP